MKFRPIRCVAVLALLGLTLTGCAVTKTPYSRSGFYAGAALIGSISEFDDTGGADLDDSDLTAGVGIRGGYRFFDRFAIEAGYEAYQDFEFDIDDVSIQTFNLNGKFFPLTGILQPYGLLGVGIVDAEVDGIDLDTSEPFFRVGAGLEAYITEWFPVFLELDYTVPGDDAEELEFGSAQLGVLFRF